MTNNNAIDLWTTLRSHNGFNSGTGPITIHSAGLQIRNSVTLGGVISGPGGLNAFDLIYGVDGGIGAGGEFKGDITLRDSQTVRIDGWGPMWSALTISGIVDDGGNGYGLNVTSNSGAARLFLTRPNTFSGDTTVAAATPNNYIGVGIGHNLALQNSALVVNRQYTAMIGSGVTTPTIGGLKGTEALASACAAASFAWADSYYSNVTALTLNLAAGKTCTYSGAIADGATGMAVIKNGDGTQELGGANTYTGNTLVNAGQLTLTDTGSMAFKLTNSSSNALTGTGTVVLNGAFAFDRTAVSVTSGTWTIVDVGTLGVTYGPTFGVTGFDKVGGVWSKSGWVFDPATGMLTYAPTALITSFSYTDGSGTYTGVIDQIAKTISLGPLPSSTSLATLNPSFTLNSGTCNRTSGSPPSPTFAAQNPATYTVTDGGVVNDYIVTVYVAPVPPYGLSGLDMWLDASAPYSISLAGSAVTEWRDARGLSGKATTRAGTPTVATGIGGLPTIHFNTSSWMNDGVNRAAGPVTILYVSRQTGGTNARVLSATSNNWLMGYHGNQYSRFYFEGWVYEAGPSSNTNPHLFAATIGGSGQPSTVYSDGTLLVSNTNGTQGPNNLQLNGYSSGSEPSDCDISEIMVYNRVLSATELNAVGSYLATKYALTTNYPGSGEIVSFGIPGSSGVIDRTAKTIALTVPYTPWNAGLSSLAPTFALTSGTCDQTSGSPPSPDFGALNPATYTVTDGAIVNAYTVTVTVAAPRTGKDMSNVLFAGSGYGPAHPANTNNVGTDWVLQVRSGTSRNPLSPTYVMSSGATGNPASGSPLDFSGVPQPYRISAEDETYQDYAVVVKEWAGYAARVMTSNPYAYWPLNEGKGLVAYDNTAGINAAYSSAGITYSVAGPAVLSGDDTAISTDGTGTNAVRIPHNAALCPDGPFSVEMWVKPFSVPPPSSPRYIASNCRISGDREGWYMAQDAGGTFGTGTNSIVVRLFKRSGTNNTQVWVPIDTVKWYHIALTYDGTKARLYKDGVCEDVENKGWANVAAYFGSTHPDPFTIGVRSDSNFPWPGSAAGVAFFTRSLTAEEILSHATAPPTLSYADWAATKYPTADLTDPTADLDRDGMSNFGEYAFGLDPTTGSSVNPNTAPLDKGTHKFRYTRTENTGLSYTVWTSADLQAWNGPATVTETVVGTPSEGVETVEVTLTAPPAGDELFVRVQAE
ncbi:MAG: hypothetical protein NTW21_40210 [Verrucomicrobia bacterium]|nr:hypothetical protein [Verrucomicrobiota bacterium]